MLSLLLSVDQLLYKNVEMECTLGIYSIWFCNKAKMKYQAYILVYPKFLLKCLEMWKNSSRNHGFADAWDVKQGNGSASVVRSCGAYLLFMF